MPQDRRAYNRAYYEHIRDLKAEKPSPTALERLGRPAAKRGGPATCTEAQIEALHQRWIAQQPRISLADLAGEVGLSRQRLHQLFRQRHWERRLPGKRHGPGRRSLWGETRVAALYARWQSGVTLRKLGEESGVTGARVRHVFQRYLREQSASVANAERSKDPHANHTL